MTHKMTANAPEIALSGCINEESTEMTGGQNADISRRLIEAASNRIRKVMFESGFFPCDQTQEGEGRREGVRG